MSRSCGAKSLKGLSSSSVYTPSKEREPANSPYLLCKIFQFGRSKENVQTCDHLLTATVISEDVGRGRGEKKNAGNHFSCHCPNLLVHSKYGFVASFAFKVCRISSVCRCFVQHPVVTIQFRIDFLDCCFCSPRLSLLPLLQRPAELYCRGMNICFLKAISKHPIFSLRIFVLF